MDPAEYQTHKHDVWDLPQSGWNQHQGRRKQEVGRGLWFYLSTNWLYTLGQSPNLPVSGTPVCHFSPPIYSVLARHMPAQLDYISQPPLQLCKPLWLSSYQWNASRSDGSNCHLVLALSCSCLLAGNDTNGSHMWRMTKLPQWPGFTRWLPEAKSVFSPWTITRREINIYFVWNTAYFGSLCYST